MYSIAILTVILTADVPLDASAMSASEVNDFNQLLQRRDVQVELGVTTAQLLNRDFHARMIALSRQFEQRMSELSKAEIQAFTQQRQVEKLSEALKALSPEQQKRLQQIHRQYQGLTRGPFVALDRSLELTDPQKTLLKNIQSAFEADLRKALWDFYRQSQIDLQQELTPEQREVWNLAVGQPFDFEQSYPEQSLIGVLQ